MKIDNYLTLGFLSRLLCAVLIAVVCLPAELDAKNNKNKNKKRRPLTKKGAAAELPTIKSVSKDSMVFNGKIYFFADNIKVVINGNEATTRQLKPGMQAMVSGKVLTYGRGGASNTYVANRITARIDNKLQEKAKEANRKAAEAARKANQRNKNRNKNKRR